MLRCVAEWGCEGAGKGRVYRGGVLTASLCVDRQSVAQCIRYAAVCSREQGEEAGVDW